MSYLLSAFSALTAAGTIATITKPIVYVAIVAGVVIVTSHQPFRFRPAHGARRAADGG